MNRSSQEATRIARALLSTFLSCSTLWMTGGDVYAQAPESRDRATFMLAGLEIHVEGDVGAFNLEVETERPAVGVAVANVRLVSPSPAAPPPLSLTWSMPAKDVYGQWTTASGFEKALGPDWAMSRVSSMLARNAPVMTLFGNDDGNRLTFAVSDALNTVILRAGVREELKFFIDK